MGKVYHKNYNKSREKYIRKRLGVRHTYIVQCVGTSYYKIGSTTTFLQHRVSGLQVGCPFELKCRLFIPINIEKILHEIFANKLVRGEWYNLNKDDAKTIIRIALQFGALKNVQSEDN